MASDQPGRVFVYQRGRVYWITWRVGGRKFYESAGTSNPRKAERAKLAKEDALARGEGEPLRRFTLELLVEGYRESYLAAGGRELAESRKRSWRRDNFALRNFVEFARGRGIERADRVTPELVEDFKIARGKVRASATVNHDLRVCKAAWNWARRMKRLQGDNPFSAVKPIKLPRTKIKFLSTETVRALLVAIKGEPLEPLIATGIYAGLRIGELLALEWSCVSFDEGFVRVSNTPTFHTKSREDRVVPLAAELAEILRALHARRAKELEEERKRTGERERKKVEGLCFTTKDGKPLDDSHVRRSLRRIGKRIGFPKLSPHVLRKSFATLLRERRVPLEKISKWLGHSSVKVTEDWYAEHVFDPADTDIDRLRFAPTTAPVIDIVPRAERALGS